MAGRSAAAGAAPRAPRGSGGAPAAIQDSLVEQHVEALFWQELGRWPRRDSARRVGLLEARAQRRFSALLLKAVAEGYVPGVTVKHPTERGSEGRTLFDRA